MAIAITQKRHALDFPKFDATSATIAGMINTAPKPSRNDTSR